MKFINHCISFIGLFEVCQAGALGAITKQINDIFLKIALKYH
ncbi:hypothetical protein ADICYQ_5965 [Cyclobacterium qasimii M12-11B]|uniref:Uncharacterized protein n=1 Tax=Cyclobacterium qasimii M12-11B TaxID=641524 RepID=S7V543_9BACT|nr:hypothetical protein ADICYQ_5965 [Cyclobacterium qasimii M12-11B]